MTIDGRDGLGAILVLAPGYVSTESWCSPQRLDWPHGMAG